MTDSWKVWEGRTVDGKFVLGNYLGGSAGSAVFRASIGSDETRPADAAIKLVSVTDAEAEIQLRCWQVASQLTNPNLIRILTIGRCTLDGRNLVYAVEEFAEENLSQIIPERALTAEEARAMLAPVLAALEFVHGKGLVHGRIQPANILAAGDQVKLSSDSLRPAGEIPQMVTAYDAPEVLAEGISPVSDMWSLGITLVEVFTQHRPAWDPARLEVVAPDLDKNVPEPFRGIVRRCLQVDPAKRAGAHEIASLLEGSRPGLRRQDQPEKDRPEETRLEGKSAPAVAIPATVDAIAASARKRANGPYLLVLAAAIVVTIFLIVRPRPSRGPGEMQTSPAPPQAPSSQTSAPQTSPPQTSPPQSALPASPSQTMHPPGGEQEMAATDEVIERATPRISAGAQRTIQGKIKVRVRVEVDADGNVMEAKLKDAGPSQYFARAALEAAQRWKFAAANGETRRSWTLLFAFTRARTEMSASHAR